MGLHPRSSLSESAELLAVAMGEAARRIHAGDTLVSALQLRGFTSPAVGILREVASLVEAGEPLLGAVARYPHVFDAVLREIMDGCVDGHLHQTADYLSDKAALLRAQPDSLDPLLFICGLGHLTNFGVPLTFALTVAAEVAGTIAVVAEARRILADLEGGRTLPESVHANAGFYPLLAVPAFELGYEFGVLGVALLDVVHHHLGLSRSSSEDEALAALSAQLSAAMLAPTPERSRLLAVLSQDTREHLMRSLHRRRGAPR